MALPPATSWLLISLLAVTTAPSTCEETESVRIADAGGLLQCYPAPALTNATNGTAFRATLLPLLGSLPSAAAHTGFASLHSAARGQRAFARGLCFGNSTAPSECARCLSAAVGNLTAGCGATSRRAGIWSDRCFLAYADTNASSPSEDAFLARVLLPGDDAVHVPASEPNTKSFYYAHLHKELVAMARQVARRAAANISGPRILATADKTKYKGAVSRTVHVLAQCGRDRTAADCVRCLRDSAQAVDWELHAARGDGGVAAAVVGFTCYLRFEVSTAVGGDSIDARPKKDRATWTNGRTGFLVSMMKEYSDVGKYRAQNGWTKEGWQAMKNRLNERPPGANFTVQQLKDREQRLKKELNVVKSIVEKSGFGWDPELKVPTAIDEKWAELSSEQRKWRHKQFPYYDVLYGIYEVILLGFLVLHMLAGVLAMFFCAFGA